MESDARRIAGFCALCRSRCGSVSVVRDGVFLRQEPNPDHPTGKALCLKGKAAAEIVHNTQRLTHPLRRTAPKGAADPGWEAIGWDEALRTIGERLGALRTAHGAETVAFSVTTPSGSPISDGIKWIERLVTAFGSPNLARGTEICNWHKDFNHAYTFGRGIGSPDFRNADCIVLWGHNPSATWLDHATAVAEAKARGARLIVIDPRATGFATRADHWLRVRPGADGALALSIAHEMIQRGRFDAAFLARWSNGPFLVRADTGRFLQRGDLDGSGSGDLVALDEKGGLLFYDPALRGYRGEGAAPVLIRDAVLLGRDGADLRCRTAFGLYADLCARHDAATTQAVTSIPPEAVRAAAYTLSAGGPVSYYTWSGISQHINAAQTDRAIALLFALTGSFDGRGGNLDFTHHQTNDLSGGSLMPPGRLARCISAADHPLGPARKGWIGSDALYRAILQAEPYAIRGLVGFGANLLLSHASPERGREALRALDFFVQCDVVMTPTAELADIVLPVNTPWEREALRVGFEVSQEAEELIQLRPAMVPSLGESRSDAEIVLGIAHSLGMEEQFFGGSLDAGHDHVLAHTGLTVAALRARQEGIRLPLRTRYRKYETEGFATPTGRLEIYSEPFLDHGYDPLPVFRDGLAIVREAAGETGRYPLILSSAKLPYYCHSQHRHVPSLRRRMPHPEALLSAGAAAARGIVDGDAVVLSTPAGEAVMRARIDDTLDGRVVFASYGWWQGNDALGLPPSGIWGERGSNYNILISDDAIDPISGAAPHRAYPCELRPLDAPGDSGWLRYHVARTVREARGMTSLYLEPERPGPVSGFRPGQFATIRIADEAGTIFVRTYSLSSSPSETRFLRITVKQAGRVSALLNGPGMEGRQIALRPGAGAFHLPDVLARPVIMIAGGIGITPFMSMLHALAGNSARPPALLFYGVRDPADFAFREEIGRIVAACPWIGLRVFVSNPEAVLEPSWTRGRISTGAIQAAVRGEADYFLCGPGPMIESLCAGLAVAGVEPRFVHTKAFGPASLKRGALPPQPVHLLRSDRRFTWEPDRGSLLDQIQTLGIPVSSGCRAGQCETCGVRRVSGVVEPPPDAVGREKDRCLLCVDRPLSELVLDL